MNEKRNLLIEAQKLLKTIKYYRKTDICNYKFGKAIDKLRNILKELNFIYALNLLKYCKKEKNKKNYQQVNNFYIPFDFNEKLKKIEKLLKNR
jgi:hypothetical protein